MKPRGDPLFKAPLTITLPTPVITPSRSGTITLELTQDATGVLFAIADVLTEIDPGLVPGEWEFRQSPFGADTEDYNYQTRSMPPNEAARPPTKMPAEGLNRIIPLIPKRS